MHCTPTDSIENSQTRLSALNRKPQETKFMSNRLKNQQQNKSTGRVKLHHQNTPSSKNYSRCSEPLAVVHQHKSSKASYSINDMQSDLVSPSHADDHLKTALPTIPFSSDHNSSNADYSRERKDKPRKQEMCIEENSAEE